MKNWYRFGRMLLRQDPAEVKQAELFLQKLGVKPLQILAVPNGSCVTCTSERDELQDAEGLVLDAELLYRLCCPFNGKASIDNLKIKQPNHPCEALPHVRSTGQQGWLHICGRMMQGLTAVQRICVLTSSDFGLVECNVGGVHACKHDSIPLTNAIRCSSLRQNADNSESTCAKT